MMWAVFVRYPVTGQVAQRSCWYADRSTAIGRARMANDWIYTRYVETDPNQSPNGVFFVKEYREEDHER